MNEFGSFYENFYDNGLTTRPLVCAILYFGYVITTLNTEYTASRLHTRTSSNR